MSKVPVLLVLIDLLEQEKVCKRYLYFSCMVYDDQPQENDCRKAYQAF